jgi:hypothetical protein
MSVLFKRGQELNRVDGLNVFLKAKDGTPRNAAEISYSIYDFTTGVEVLCPPADRYPINPSIGEYFAAFRIPNDANIGKYHIRWHFRQYLNTKQIEILQEFNIVGDSTQVVSVPGITPAEYDLVRGIRIMLRDNNPDRNYHFVPPAGEEAINQFTRVFGYIWQDDELLEFLRVSLDSINMYTPQTFYDTLDSLMNNHRNWRTLLFVGSMVHAISAMSLNWIVDEFSLAPNTYLSVFLGKKEICLSIEDLYNTCFDVIDVANETSVAIKHAFINGGLSVNSVNNDGGVVKAPIENVLRHHTEHKRAFKVVCADGSDVTVTEDHSLFTMNGSKLVSIETKNIEIGSDIVIVNNEKIIKLTKVIGVNEVDSLKVSYDLSIPIYERFTLSNGILAHNSYSIGGVNLDIDKSSKYQSMAGDAQTRFTEMVTAAKGSVLIARGLKQSRYGVGIRSSFGPSVGRGALTPARFLGV